MEAQKVQQQRISYRLVIVADLYTTTFDDSDEAQRWFEHTFGGARIGSERVANLLATSDVDDTRSHFTVEKVEQA